ncbi:hypothetical protein Pcinc_038855 [Petrolisthes cinctipes]|uniref:Uncharacterized protein n=1 Tax=Petrolisthes cinctipes TaxID=88211 RepID=A0AAE1EJI7_PETCI|nr:hypothetical protein Pcinc_038855 [Petrolisthes cinctipes]
MRRVRKEEEKEGLGMAGKSKRRVRKEEEKEGLGMEVYLGVIQPLFDHVLKLVSPAYTLVAAHSDRPVCKTRNHSHTTHPITLLSEESNCLLVSDMF